MSDLIAQYNDQLQPIFEEVMSNPQKGRKTAIRQLEQLSDKESIGLTYNIIGLSYAVINQVDSAEYYFELACKQLMDSDPMLPRILTNKAILYRNNNDLPAALDQLFKALRLSQLQDNKNAIALIYGELSSVYSLLSRIHEAMDYSLKTIEILEQEQADESVIAIEKQKLANFYLKTNDFDFAKKLYDEVLLTLKHGNQTYSYLITKINYADIIQHLNGTKISVEYLNEMKTETEQYGNELLKALYFSKLGKHIKKIDRLKSIDYYEEAIELAFRNVSTYSLSIITEYLSTLLEFKNHKRYLEILHFLQPLIDNHSFPIKDMINYLDNNITFYENTNDITNAFESLKSQQALLNKESALANKVSIIEIQEKYKSNLLLKENQILNQEIELKKRNNTIIFVSLFCVIIVAIATLITKSASEKRKRSEEQNKIIKEKLRTESKLRTVREQTIQSQKKELYDLFTANYNLNVNLSKLKDALKEKQNQHEVLIHLSKMEANENNWEELISKMRVLEKKFFNALFNAYPTLTKKELDFCALVRIGLEYKQIANVLHISHNSVLTKKYRITKKINLDKDVDFQNWLMQFD